MFVALWVFALGVSTLIWRGLLHDCGWAKWWWLWFLLGILFLIARECMALTQHLAGAPLHAQGEGAPGDVGAGPRHGVAGWEQTVLLGVGYAACLLCWGGVLRHARHIHALRSNSPRTADMVMDIILFPVAFGTLAGHAARMMMADRPWTARAALEAADTFESWALASVFAIFEVRSRGSVGHHGLLRFGVHQFLVVNAAASAIQFFLQGFAPCPLCYRLGDSSCFELSHRLETPVLTVYGVPLGALGVVLGVSSTVALACIVRLERRYHAELRGIDPHSKFMGVKLLVSVLFFQPYALRFIAPGEGATGGLLPPGLRAVTPEWWNAWLLTVETLLLHLFHCYYAYPVSDFGPGGAMALLARTPCSPPGPFPDDAHAAGAVAVPVPAQPPPSPKPAWGIRERIAMYLFGLPFLLLLGATVTFASSQACAPAAVPYAVAQRSVHYICDRVEVTCAKGYAFPSGALRASAVCGKDGSYLLDGTGGAASCSACAAGYVEWPRCLQCSSAKHCAGHAASVRDDGTRSRCVCQCEARWAGEACDQCAPGFEGADCDRCTVGRIAYPACTECTSAQHCSGHAESVSDDGARGKCVCSCRDRWAGAACDRCAKGRTGYPSCAHAATQGGCACLDEWSYCRLFGIFSCNVYRGCADTQDDRKWCRTASPCSDSWDYC
eukprot:TRINITY_DN43257_c0_g1_i1.p1 TRINITY_DN43257_c0_g1~~TRINITY_DN43257_c0_g1_i1.p1  ORF type:complete len:693 (+),score=180.62 TRINITY_DN43257_c0_g1_i1:74-2080(+)